MAQAALVGITRAASITAAVDAPAPRRALPADAAPDAVLIASWRHVSDAALRDLIANPAMKLDGRRKVLDPYTQAIREHVGRLRGIFPGAGPSSSAGPDETRVMNTESGLSS